MIPSEVSLFSLPFYQIFWCLFSLPVEHRWKSDVFQPESNDIFTLFKTHLGLTDKNLTLNVQTNTDILSRVWSEQQGCCLLIAKCEQITKNINFATISPASWLGTNKENSQTSANGSQTLPEGSFAEDLYLTCSPQSMFCSWQQIQRVSSCVKHAVFA